MESDVQNVKQCLSSGKIYIKKWKSYLNLKNTLELILDHFLHKTLLRKTSYRENHP